MPELPDFRLIPTLAKRLVTPETKAIPEWLFYPGNSLLRSPGRRHIVHTD